MGGFGEGFREGELKVPIVNLGTLAETGSIWYRVDQQDYQCRITGALYSIAIAEDVAAGVFAGDVSVGGNLYISGSVSDFTATGSAKFNVGLSGSLTRLVNGASFIEAGSVITVTSASNGAVTVALTNPANIPGDLSVRNNLYVSGSVSDFTATGSAKFNVGLSGSLTRLTNGNSYLEAGNNITLLSQSNGSVTINVVPLIQAGFVAFNNSAAQTVVFSSSFTVSPVVVVTAQENVEGVAVILTVDAVSQTQFSVTSSATFTGRGHFVAMVETTT